MDVKSFVSSGLELKRHPPTPSKSRWLDGAVESGSENGMIVLLLRVSIAIGDFCLVGKEVFLFLRMNRPWPYWSANDTVDEEADDASDRLDVGVEKGPSWKIRGIALVRGFDRPKI